MNTEPITLFLSPRYSQDSRIASEAAYRKGWNVKRLPRWGIPTEIPAGKIVVYGETLFARFMEEHLPFRLLDPAHNWLTTLPPETLHRKIILSNAGEARNITQPAFVKPVDDKTFKAGIFRDGDEIPKHLDDSEPVLISEIVEWEIEYRFFLLHGKVLTGSVYARSGELNSEPGSEEDFEEAALLAEKYSAGLPGGVVVDIGQIKGRGWAIVEANPAWGAGFYECDAELALDAVAASCGTK